MTKTVLGVEVVESLDFDPSLPCECKSHALSSPNDLPASWAIYWKRKFPCGCIAKTVSLYCAECWGAICDTLSGDVGCFWCNARAERISDYILRIETLKK